VLAAGVRTPGGKVETLELDEPRPLAADEVLIDRPSRECPRDSKCNIFADIPTPGYCTTADFRTFASKTHIYEFACRPWQFVDNGSNRRCPNFLS
jgi:hypothetical protein